MVWSLNFSRNWMHYVGWLPLAQGLQWFMDWISLAFWPENITHQLQMHFMVDSTDLLGAQLSVGWFSLAQGDMEVTIYAILFAIRVPELDWSLHFLSGWVNDFLSWEPFEPLSRLCYNIYLVHLTILALLTNPVINTPVITHLFVVKKLFTVTILSTLVSAVLFVCVELPWANTEKILFECLLGKRNAKSKSSWRKLSKINPKVL